MASLTAFEPHPPRTMSEQEPLLPAHNSTQVYDPSDSGHDMDSLYYKCQKKTAQILEHPTLHKIVITLIAIDATCVLIDLGYSFLSPGCSAPGEEHDPIWMEVLSHISLFINSLFLFEIPLTLWALGLQYMNPFGPVPHASLHLFDSTIIVTTFVLEVILRGKERELAGLIVVLRLWRLVKLVGGVVIGAGDMQEENAHILAETKRQLEEVTAQLSEARDENMRLRKRLDQTELVS
ncbi:hypothetical protein M413DRAFT_438391 [Hebeloma cylindrosporum]|uniref:Hydrogen voltage-gated channel 1 n=1 Tax=Hebeloma cylindrosporum TaxID=76867 RepID=A0A0C3CYI7_HEBCY|nr:hypothetical protein M413DRAFT_438391 [Hebeloma cylindrosporum h7]